MIGKLILACMMCVTVLPLRGALELAEDGKSCYEIVVPENAIPAEKTAAKELQAFLRLAAGADIPIVRSDSRKKILIGQSREISEKLGNLDFTELEPDETIRCVKGDTLILTGGRPRGTLYAVNTFLEEQLGIRWWTPDEMDVPVRKRVVFDDFFIRYKPALKLRDVSYTGSWRNQSPLYMTRLRLNGWNTLLGTEYGGYVPLIGNCHSFYSLLPPSKYKEKHPDWYSNHQLCLTNDAMRAELTRNVIARIKSFKAKGIEATMVSVCQEDARGWCECPKCKAVIEEEGSLTGYLIRFVNKVADSVGRLYPDVKIVTFSYDMTTPVEFRTRVADNVIIHVAPLHSDFGKPLGDPVRNKTTFTGIRKWAEKTRNIIVWNYVANFYNYLVPHPNTGFIASDIRFFIKNGSLGLFLQGSGLSNLDNMLPFRRWYSAQLLWNPDRNERELREEFFSGYFGAGGKFLMEYLDKMEKAAAEWPGKISCYHFREPEFMDEAFVRNCRVLFDKALTAVKGDRKLEKRIRRERIQLDVITIMKHMIDHVPADELKEKGLGDPLILYSEFKQLAKENKLLFFAENKYIDSFYALLESARQRKKAEIPEQFKNRTVFDLQISDKYNDKNGVREVIDKAASDHVAFHFKGDGGGWGLMMAPPYAELQNTGIQKWEVWLNVRAEGSGDACNAFHMGAYTYQLNKECMARNFTMREIKSSEYKLIYAGTLDITGNPLFWFGAPACKTDAVKSIRLDRVLMIGIR